MACCCELQNTLDVEVIQDALLDVKIGGSAGALLQAKSVDITENGTIVVAPDDGFDGLKSVEINTNVPKRFECGDAYFVPPSIGATSIILSGLLQKIDASCWDTSKVESFSDLFEGCSHLQSLDVSGWNTALAIRMDDVFYNCSSLQKLDLSGWDISKVTRIYWIFRNCLKLELLDISGWNASVIRFNDLMFLNCNSLRTIIGEHTIQDVESGLKTMIGLKISIKIQQSPLRFSSILALANGLADLTGGTAQTLTISSGSYKNMYNDDDTVPTADVIAERQARIAAICAAKNWNFAH